MILLSLGPNDTSCGRESFNSAEMMENDQQFASSLTRGKGCSADSGYLDSAASKEPANTSSSSTNEINAVNSSEQVIVLNIFFKIIS